MKRFISFLMAFIVSCLLRAEELPWPSVSLSNGVMQMTSYTPGVPGSFYKAGRFVHGSLLDNIKAGSAAFYVRHYPGAHNPLGLDSVCGPAEEFDLNTSPPGYDEVADGGLFLKIGVGVLRRPADVEKYEFFKAYDIVDSGVWTTEALGGTGVVYRHTVALPDKRYGVEYEHRITLDAKQPVARVTRTLRNTGGKTIVTRHYNHQFLAINAQPVGAAYSLELGFAPTPEQSLGDAIRISGRNIQFTRDVTGTLWSPMSGFTDAPTDHRFTLRHGNGAAVHYATDRPVADFCLYVTPRIICPEFFIDLCVAPGTAATWSSELRFELPK